jgi:preprotein translocase subunit SecG
MVNTIRPILEGILALLSLTLIALVATQTSKNEGFGTIGVPAPTNFKGKPGYEERMKLYTRYVAIAWIAFGFVLSLMLRG